MEIYVGIDIGTTHAKAIALDENGVIVNELKSNYPFAKQQFDAEQDAEIIWNTVLQLLHKLVAQTLTKKIAGISFSAVMHSVLAVDKSGKPLTPVFTWADARAQAKVKLLDESGKGEWIYRKSGTPIHPMSPLLKIRWMKDHSEIFSAAAKFISIKEYVIHKLSGEYVIDYSTASATGMFDISELAWLDNALEFAGINKDQLSIPVPITHELSITLSLLKGIKLVAGSTDGCFAGASLEMNKGFATVSIGTSGAVRIFTKTPILNEEQKLFCYYYDEGMYVCGGPINNGGLLLRWMAENIFHPDFDTKNLSSWCELASQVEAGCDGLICLPYIFGERAPIWDTNVTGAFVGLKNTHTKEYMVRAAMEGICYSLKHVMDAVEELYGEIDTVVTSGGVLEETFMMQLLADVLDKKLISENSPDASCMMAADLAAAICGRNFRHERLTMKTVFNPRPLYAELYKEGYLRYRKISEMIRSV